MEFLVDNLHKVSPEIKKSDNEHRKPGIEKILHNYVQILIATDVYVKCRLVRNKISPGSPISKKSTLINRGKNGKNSFKRLVELKKNFECLKNRRVSQTAFYQYNDISFDEKLRQRNQ